MRAGHCMTFEPPNNQAIKSFCRDDQAIKGLGTERSSDQKQFSPIKILDPGRKRFYRRRVCDHPL